MHSLIYIIAALVVVGVLLWALESLPMIDATIKQVAKVVIVVAAVLWLLSVFFGTPAPFPLR